jgi:CO/xanthine dehydrogenase FAD-binding subunit
LKPPAFAYHDPRELEEALSLLADHGEDGKALAGGQSLVPLLNFRLAHPEHLIDLNRIDSLAYLRRAEGRLRIGAMTRQSRLERSALAAEGWPLLSEALTYVAHAQIRNRGTVGGSVAHADPAAELPVAFAALDAEVTIASAAKGTRTIPISELFVTHLTTTIEPDELLTEIAVAPLPERSGHAFVEFARRHGDFALGGAAVQLSLDAQGSVDRCAIALLGAAAIPLRASEAEAMLRGSELDQDSARAAAEAAIADISPTGDIHGSAEYRRELCAVMVRRALVLAHARATGSASGEPGPNGAPA